MTQMELDTAVRLLADVQASQIRKKNQCTKLQFTSYGSCEFCSDRSDCKTLHIIREGE